jgi:RHS repeat-associated protein
MNAYSYDAFGNVVAQTEVISQPFKFVGQHGVMTEPNGFYYMRARYYDPQVGRFISEDPIGFDGGDVNLMAYVGSNPVLGVDPWGYIVSKVYRPLAIGYGIGKLLAFFGIEHVAVQVNNDQIGKHIYGFGPDGVMNESKNTSFHRSVVIHPGNEYDQATLDVLKNAADKNDPRFIKETYSAASNNCYSFADTAIKEGTNNAISKINSSLSRGMSTSNPGK